MCEHDLDFIMIDGDENVKALAGNIADMLHYVGFHVNIQLLSKEDFNTAHEAGDFHLAFTETWGAPYDPHAYAMGWVAGDEGAKVAMSNLIPPYTRDQLFKEIEAVLREENLEERELKWESIHKAVHKQAVFLPLWGKRIPTVLSDRLTGYEAGSQQFDYPVHRLEVLSGSTTVTIAPGAQTGAFESVGRLDPHSYRPNEFFASNWVYEGLVHYGPQGQILPALATSWTILEANGEGEGDGDSTSETYSFSLRPNVTFHDGAPWNCAAASLNFDHVLVEPFLTSEYHGWHQLVNQISSWECLDDMTFAITTRTKYYPLLQELSYIRPLRMLSPSAFVGGADPVAENSCPADWGDVATPDGTKKVTCVGILNVFLACLVFH
jgi:ABC-type transport system substrate-binding protein